MIRRLGFTLAEVLITLGIIGVVAAMTIPSLINQTNGAEFKTGAKKMMSVLNQVITMTVAVDGYDFSQIGAGTVGVNSGSVYDTFSRKMNIMKGTTGNDTTFYTPGGAGNYSLWFNDGMAITFPNTATNCDSAGKTGCRMVVDINGAKRPNALSTAVAVGSTLNDQFVFDFYDQSVTPHDSKTRWAIYDSTN